MSRSRPRVDSRCSFQTASRIGVVEQRHAVVAAPRPSRASSRRAKSRAIAQSSRASPGGATAGAHAADAALAVGHGAVLLAPGRRRQQHVGVGAGRGGGERLLHHDELAALERARAPVAWSGIDCAGLVQAIQSALISPRPTASNISTAVLPGRAGHARRRPTGARPRRDAPALREVAMRRQQVGHAADLAPAHRVRLAGQRERPGAGLADLAGRQVQVDQRRRSSRCRSCSG